jgi:hypothetical protein
MAEFSQVRRSLRFDAAHRTVGVSGIAAPSRSLDHTESESAGTPKRVLLVSNSNDGRDAATIAAFQRILLDRRDLWCERVDMPTAERESLAEGDCAIVFGRGLQIVSHWSAFDPEAADGFEEADRVSAKIELGNAARWHPVLQGVRPFILHNGTPSTACLRMNTTNLLIHRAAGKVIPIAWARHGEHRAVCTSLGREEDFQHPEFVRLLLNALDWVTR